MTIRCALLDAADVYVGMVDVDDPADLTDRHLPQITACDLPGGEYRWQADAGNPYGGAFVALPERVRAAARAAREGALP